jgi:Concanavalin A-like lectin/glucanases superfamily
LTRASVSRHRLRWLVAAVVGTVAAAVAVGVPVLGPPATSIEAFTPITETPNAGLAFAAAKRQNQNIVVTSLGTPTRKVSAKPDGSLVAELSSEPMQVKRGDSWAPIDTALAVRGNGIAPKTVGTDLVFSGGGDTPLVRFGAPGQSFTLSWPGKLPKPTTDGAKATYAEVLPGVDLVLTAGSTGFSQHLVVKTPAAAAKIGDVRLGLATDGLTVQPGDNGVVRAVNAKGDTVFQTPPSTMWDAGAEKRATVGVKADQTSLTLVPDRSFLTDPKARFPITIDPDWRTFDRSDWAKVFSATPDSTHFYGANDVDTWGKLGTCVGWSGCSGVGVARTYWQFDTSFLSGKRIISTEFDATIVYGPNCNTRNYELYIADRTFDGGLTWNNQPHGTYVDTSPADSAYTGCAGNKGLGFSVGQYINPNGWSAYTVKAQDEGDKYAWRKLDAGATRIIVNYNTRPNPASSLATQPPLNVCKWCNGTAYVGDDSIRLQGTLSDPDNDQLTAIWDVYGGPSTEHHEGPTLASGSVFTQDIDLRNRDGQTVRWTLWGSDGPDGGDSRNGPGPFIVDRVGVDKAPGVTGQLYQEDNQWHGGVGVPGTFTFDASGVTDIDHYLYGWNDPPATQVDADALGGKAVVSIAPPSDGPQDLYVQSVDRAGHRSPTKKMHIYVRAGNGPVAQWSFEGNTNDSAYLGSRNGTLSGGATYTPGAVGSSLALDGTGYMTAPNTVRTDISFSVSAWAKITSGGTAQAIVSEDGDKFGGFDLWYRPENGARWVFGIYNSTSNDTASSATAAQIGVWTQLTAVYDAPSKQMRLYVDGVLSATVLRTVVAPSATGSLRVGRTLWNSNPASDPLTGGVDEVKVYDRSLDASEISAAVSRDNVQVGYWKLDDPSGKTAANVVPGGSAGVLQGNAHFVTNGAVNGAVQLDQSTDYVSTNGPAFRTDQSFTLATWARLDVEPAATAISTVAAQNGATNSAFTLGYRNNSAGDWWEFYTTGADAKTHPGDAAVHSAPGTAKVGEWAQITAVDDVPNKQIRIYVNGVLAGSAPQTSTFNATGPLLFGRMLWEGVVGNYWTGGIDDVRAYSRVLSDEEIRGIVSQASVTQGNWKLDGNLKDSSPKPADGTAVGQVDYTGGQSSMPDPNDLAARLDGKTSAISAPHVIDVDRSFAVAAWVKADSANALATVVSEDGSQDSAFKLRVRQDGKWGFVMFAKDAPDDGTQRDEVVGGAVQIGQWTHLAAVYDSGAHQLQLYVNGTLAGSVAHTQTWNASGGLQIGRAKWAGAPVEYLAGSVDDVSVYSRALFASEIQAMAGRDLTLVHNYALDESSGRNSADAVGARGATLTGGASFGPGRVGNAANFDGSTGAATTTGVDLRLDQAFTVSAWVLLPNKDCDLSKVAACRVDAVTVDGAHSSKFRLGHIIDADNNQLGAWTFEMPESDADNAVVTKAAVSTQASDVNTWTHLVGVYDPATKKIWLYVNGTRVGDGTLNSPWQPTGGVAIGRGRMNSANAEFWPGSVDDVRLYTGQLDKDRVSALYHSYPAVTASALPKADAAQWKYDENTGATAKDSSGRGLDLTTVNTSWIGGRDMYATNYNGTTAYGQTTVPVVDTGRSFSVASWVYLLKGGTDNQTVIGQDGTRLSSFALSYNGPAGKWAVIAPTVDKDNPGSAVNILNSTEAARPGEWTHLAMSYDADLHQVRLYVNGLLSGAQVGVTLLPATGPMSVARAKWNGNASALLNGVVDDTRVFAKAISDGEARKIHDDVTDADWGYYRFDDGTAKDSSWRGYTGTLSGGTGFGPDASSGKALQLDGTSGALTTPAGLPMHDSFTVSAWADLSRDDKDATVVSQDGDRNSGYYLGYRADIKRWVFGSSTSDTDGSAKAYAASPAAATVNRWTSLAGVYDYPARQLRLYVDGQLVGSRNNVVLWPANGKMVIGRGKDAGVATAYFPGSIDEVRSGEGVGTDAVLADRGSFAAPIPGQLGSFVNSAGDHYTGPTDTVRPGYHFESALGLPASPGQNTRTLYACATTGGDSFTSLQADCEGQTKIGTVGLVFTQQPNNIPTVALYRCNNGAGDHFESRDATCGGKTVESQLGYTVGYAALARFANPGIDHVTTIDGVPVAFRLEGMQGYVSLVSGTGLQPFMQCRNGFDSFDSNDTACEGKTVVSSQGFVLAAAPTDPSTAKLLTRCVVPPADSMVSLDAKCEGVTVDRTLGYLRVDAPTGGEFQTDPTS